jgi:hypothetical protein
VTNRRPTSEIDGPIYSPAPRIRRSGPNVRMLRLVVLVVLLAVIALGVRQFACEGASESAGPADDGSVAVEKDSRVTVAVGERFSIDGLDLVVTSLMPVGAPTRPRYPMANDAARQPRAGEAYYQAFVRAENRGESPARIGPEDFSLDADGVLISPVPVLSGPAKRSLLVGASFDIILSFIGPAGMEPRLVYRAESGGVVNVEGMLAPDAFESVTTTFLDHVPYPPPVLTTRALA